MLLEPSRDLVLKKLRDCFADSEAAAKALTIIDSYGSQSWHRERERVQLAMLMLSEASLDRLREVLASADADYRNVLVGAEYREEIQASSKTTPQEMAAIRRRDRERYEAWLQSGGGG